MNKKQKKAVGYIRVSTTVQVKEGKSFSTQRQQIVDYAKNIVVLGGDSLKQVLSYNFI